MRGKKLDIFILKSFILLMVGTFFICLFILLMNIVWRFVDDLVGKGFTIDILAKFFYYSSLTLVPSALPLAVLLASLITFGNFGERLELLAMKTTGISLLRIMRPLVILCSILALVSFYFQNVTVPNTSKKLYSLITSMSQKSPELEIPEGVFYDQISGYNLYVKQKDTRTGDLYDITIYDVSKGFEEITVIVADSARLETTADKKHLYLHLFSGEQFENMRAQQMNRNNNPYRRESFREKHILIDFNTDFNLIDDNLSGSQASSKNMKQIKHSIDSLSALQDSMGMGNLSDYKVSAMTSFPFTEKDSVALASMKLRFINVDSMFAVSSRAKQLEIVKTMQSKITAQKSALSIRGINMFQGDRSIRRHWIEWMRKISSSLSIWIFFFIGAPLGAIIRKGGLGVPVIVSVLTFILYYVTSTSGEKMFREGEWSIIGCWLSTLVLLPLSVFFTAKANMDSTVFQVDVYKEFLRYWFGGKVQRHMERKEVVINDPDAERCINVLNDINEKTRKIGAAGCLTGYPKYRALFFTGVDKDSIESFNKELEDLVEELGNSKDKVVLDMLNCLPIIPIYGVESPYKRRWINRFAGIVFPLGLLLQFRAWLFSRKIRWQLDKTASVTDAMSKYLMEKTLRK